VGHAGLINTGGYRSDGMGADGDKEDFRDIIADEGDGAAFSKADGPQAQGGFPDMIIIILPGIGVPDPEIFFS